MPDQFPLKLLLDRVFPAQVNRYDENWSKQWFGAGIFAEGSEEVSVDVFRKLERRKVLSTVERAGLLSRAEQLGVTLSSMERLGLLSKAEELGALSAATDPGTPGALLALAAPLLAAGPAVVYLVPEEHAWQVALQAVAALVCVVGGAAAVAASTFVSRLQSSSG